MCILPYCWFASVLSVQLAKIGDDAYHSLWYIHPITLQQYFRWIIIYGEIPRKFDGYNIFICTLEVFMKVRNIFTIIIRNFQIDDDITHIVFVLIFRSARHLDHTI